MKIIKHIYPMFVVEVWIFALGCTFIWFCISTYKGRRDTSGKVFKYFWYSPRSPRHSLNINGLSSGSWGFQLNPSCSSVKASAIHFQNPSTLLQLLKRLNEKTTVTLPIKLALSNLCSHFIIHIRHRKQSFHVSSDFFGSLHFQPFHSKGVKTSKNKFSSLIWSKCFFMIQTGL